MKTIKDLKEYLARSMANKIYTISSGYDSYYERNSPGAVMVNMMNGDRWNVELFDGRIQWRRIY